jgi:molybdenum cofactor cytidylyltransferase
VSTGALVLAAGLSSRMGEPKMLLPWGKGTVLSTVVESLLGAGLEQVMVVLGHRAGEVVQALGPVRLDDRVRTCVNDRYREGMLTSLQAGARALGGGNILVALGDQPLVAPGVVAEVLAAHAGGLTVPSFGGRRGHPVCIDASLTGPLLALPAETGLRKLFQDYPERVKTVAVSSGGILIDLDTPADYARQRAV